MFSFRNSELLFSFRIKKFEESSNFKLQLPHCECKVATTSHMSATSATGSFCMAHSRLRRGQAAQEQIGEEAKSSATDCIWSMGQEAKNQSSREIRGR